MSNITYIKNRIFFRALQNDAHGMTITCMGRQIPHEQMPGEPVEKSDTVSLPL